MHTYKHTYIHTYTHVFIHTYILLLPNFCLQLGFTTDYNFIKIFVFNYVCAFVCVPVMQV